MSVINCKPHQDTGEKGGCEVVDCAERGLSLEGRQLIYLVDLYKYS